MSSSASTSTAAAGPTFSWFLPTGGDGHHVGGVTSVQARSEASTRRAPTVDYLAQVANAAELAGFESVLTPTGLGCADPFITTAMVAPLTKRLRFLVAFRPGLSSPTLLAQQAATFARLTGGRLALNVVTGGDPVEQAAYGDHLPHDARYERTDEFLTVLRRLLAGERVDFAGAHLDITGAQLGDLPTEVPAIYFGGASPAAERVAATHVDTYLTWLDGPEAVAARRERVGNLAAEQGRTLRFGIRVHVISRETADEAWDEANRLLAGMDDAAIEASQARYARMDSTAQANMTALHGGRRDRLVVGQNLWAGIGLVREGAATALVGSHDEVAARLDELHALGFDEFILSGYPHLEEALRFADGVRPRLRSSQVPELVA